MTDNTPQLSGTLSGPEILACIGRSTNRLVIMPPPYSQEELKEKLQRENTIDLRLGYEFIFMRRAELATLEFRDQKSLSIDLSRFYEKVHIGIDRKLVLHPRELVLGATFEYIVLPTDIMAYIIGRSSWGRLGLIIATATVIHPGFKGCPTLELVNHGNVPIHLFPGSPIPIAQLTFHSVGSGQKPYAGKYSGMELWVGPTGPGYSKIHDDHLFSSWLKWREAKQSGERE